MRYSAKHLEDKIQRALREFSRFSFGEDGMNLECKCGNLNRVQFDGTNVTIEYTTIARLIYSLFLFDARGYVGKTENSYEDLMALLDVSRNAVRTVSAVKKLIRYLILMGYTGIQLYMEDVYEIPQEPYFGYKRGRYTQTELKEIAAYGRLFDFEVIPAIQTLAHLNGITRWRRFERLIDFGDILLVDEEETYELIDNMFASLQESFGCEKIHIGMDEAHMVGLGKYLDKHGYTDRVKIIVRHLERVCEIARQNGFTKPMMWGDMFFRLTNHGDYIGGDVPKDLIGLIPKNVTLCAWNYGTMDVQFYVDMLNKTKKFGNPVFFAGGANCWNGFTPQNHFALRQTACAMKGCEKAGVRRFIMTLWGDDGAECSVFATLPALAFCGGIANDRKDYKTLFKAMTGMSFDQFMQLDAPNQISEMNDPLVQPSRYMLYNDCLQGLFDCTVRLSDGETYKRIARRLSRLSENREWGYLFQTQAELARLLSVKYGIGVKTREAYLKGDKVKLLSLLKNEYPLILKYLDRFYKAFRVQWFAENKAYGFEVQDYRLGGLKGRVKHCKQILQDFLDGKTANVEELEDEVLNVICAPQADGKSIWFPNNVKMMVSANIF